MSFLDSEVPVALRCTWIWSMWLSKKGARRSRPSWNSQAPEVFKRCHRRRATLRPPLKTNSTYPDCRTCLCKRSSLWARGDPSASAINWLNSCVCFMILHYSSSSSNQNPTTMRSIYMFHWCQQLGAFKLRASCHPPNRLPFARIERSKSWPHLRSGCAGNCSTVAHPCLRRCWFCVVDVGLHLRCRILTPVSVRTALERRPQTNKGRTWLERHGQPTRDCITN